MKSGQEINHKRYGKAEILQVFTNESKVQKAVLLNLQSQDGRELFYSDRNMSPFIDNNNGVLAKCYEPDLNLIEI